MKHLDRKYFRYRAELVEAAQAQYPRRAKILAASEYLRLGFTCAGAALCALIFGGLTALAVGRVGPWEWRTITFGLVTCLAAWIAGRVVWFIAARAGVRRNATGSRSVT